MRKFLLAVVMVGSFGGMGAVFCLVALGQGGAGVDVIGFPREVSGTPLWILQVTQYRGPFLEDPDSLETVDSAAILVENRGGLYLASGAVILQRQEEQLVFEVRDLPPGAQALVLEKDAQNFMGAVGWQCFGWAREEYPEQQGWLRYHQLPEGLAVTNVSEQSLPVVELTYKRTGAAGYIGGISFCYTFRDLGPGETKILPLPHYGQDRIDVVKEIVFCEN